MHNLREICTHGVTAFQRMWDTGSVNTNTCTGVYLVIDKFVYRASNISSLHQIVVGMADEHRVSPV